MDPLLMNQWGGFSPDSKTEEAAVEGRRGSSLRSKERIMSANLNIRIPEWMDKICVCPLMGYRRLKYGYSFRKIYLGEGEYTIVEPPDYYKYGKYKWIYWGNGKNNYAIGELKIGHRKTKQVGMHRVIMGAPKGKVVDHINGDGLDNRRANLRLATRAQNIYNRRKTTKKTSSRFVGLSFNKKSTMWDGCIQYKRKKIHLGRFKNEIDAARAYDRAAIKYYGEFARLNFPREDYVEKN
jgi:hypothetical protein